MQKNFVWKGKAIICHLTEERMVLNAEIEN